LFELRNTKKAVSGTGRRRGEGCRIEEESRGKEKTTIASPRKSFSMGPGVRGRGIVMKNFRLTMMRKRKKARVESLMEMRTRWKERK